mmetsp:Transcript_6535/g.15998  ORF Transcript_6535/g.15998 Transcript_6535/m.15998 type:complete len:483 (+) Transcript_6535:58-1506(+)
MEACVAVPASFWTTKVPSGRGWSTVREGTLRLQKAAFPSPLRRLAAPFVAGILCKKLRMALRGRAMCRATKRTPRWAPSASGRLPSEQRGYDAREMVNEVLPGSGQCFKVVWERGIGLRAGPDVHAKRTGVDLVCGEIFEAATEVRRGGRRYFELIDGRGWAFDSMEQDGETIPLLTLAAQMYTMVFPAGVQGVDWGSDHQMRFTNVKGFSSDAAGDLMEAGMRVGDTLVMIDRDPVVGMSFSQVLNRLWATRGAQPGEGLYYRVVTENPHGIGIRVEPDVNSQRTGEDLVRGAVFQVDDVVHSDDGPTYLHLADGRGWVFDMTPVTSDCPSVQNLQDVNGPCTVTLWRGSTSELCKTIGLSSPSEVVQGPQCHVVTVLQDDAPRQQVEVSSGANLRDALMQEGLEVTPMLPSLVSCKSRSLCGTCVLEVVDGMHNLTVQSVNERSAMRWNPKNYRLSCNLDVYGDVTVRLRPPNIVYNAVA